MPTQRFEPSRETETLQGKDLRPQIAPILKALREVGTEFLVIEGVGFQYYMRSTEITGEVVAVNPGKQPFLDGEQVKERDCHVVTIKSQSSSDTFLVPLKVKCESGETITIKGVRLEIVNGAADFLNGTTDEIREARVDALRELLAQSAPAGTLSVSRGGKQIYCDKQAQREISEIRKMSEDAGRDWWDVAFKEVGLPIVPARYATFRAEVQNPRPDGVLMILPDRIMGVACHKFELASVPQGIEKGHTFQVKLGLSAKGNVVSYEIDPNSYRTEPLPESERVPRTHLLAVGASEKEMNRTIEEFQRETREFWDKAIAAASSTPHS